MHPLSHNTGLNQPVKYTIKYANSRDSDVSNFIGSDQKVEPNHLAAFQVMTSKSDFLLIGVGTITLKGSMNTANSGKTSLLVE